jgi:hypothetical protein
MKFAYIEETGEVTGINRGSIDDTEKEGVITPQHLVWGMDNEKYKVIDGIFTPLTNEEVKDIEIANELTNTISTNSTEAKLTREDVANSNIEVFGVQWQVGENDRVNINEAIDYSNNNNIPTETTQNWILADNTTRTTTKDDLIAVLNAYTERKQRVFASYITWRQTDMTEPYTHIE